MAEKQLNNPLLLQEDSTLFGMNGTEYGKFKAGFMGIHNLMHVQDQKPQNTGGGEIVACAWRTRDLNTVLTDNIAGASLADNQITLPPGVYYLESSFPVYRCKYYQGRIQKVSGTPDVLLLGCQGFVNDTVYATPARCIISGAFELEESSVVELQMYGSYNSGHGFGILANISTEIYSDLKIWKLA